MRFLLRRDRLSLGALFTLPPPVWKADVMLRGGAAILCHEDKSHTLRMVEWKERNWVPDGIRPRPATGFLLHPN